MTVGRKLKRNIFIDTDIDCQNCGCWQRVCTWNGECDNLEPMTNEEWLRQASTEDVAKWLSKVSEILYDCGQRDVFPKIMYEEDWEEWLKQPHQGE